MKWPWTKIEARTINTFQDLKKFFIDHNSMTTKALKVELMGQLNLVKRSEQIKHNRLQVRLNTLEDCFKAQLDQYQIKLQQRDIVAADEIEKGVNSLV